MSEKSKEEVKIEPSPKDLLLKRAQELRDGSNREVTRGDCFLVGAIAIMTGGDIVGIGSNNTAAYLDGLMGGAATMLVGELLQKTWLEKVPIGGGKNLRVSTLGPWIADMCEGIAQKL